MPSQMIEILLNACRGDPVWSPLLAINHSIIMVIIIEFLISNGRKGGQLK